MRIVLLLLCLLSFPALALLKQSLPDTEIHALVQEYTSRMAELCPSIDKLVLDPGKDSGFKREVGIPKNASSI